MTDAWIPEPRPVPEALKEDFQAKTYNDPFLGSILDRFDNATREQLMDMARGGIGEPHSS